MSTYWNCMHIQNAQTRRLMESSTSRALRDNCLEELISILVDGGAHQEIFEEEEARPRIQRVPTLLREVKKNRHCYDPRLFSFGPYHYRKPNLQVGQTIKTKLVRRQLSSFKETNSGNRIKDFFNNEFGKIAHEARACYAMGSTAKFNDNEFKCLMFLDGCFIVYFIHSYVNEKLEELKMKNDHIAFLIMDLLLLENQLPYMVLKALVTILMPGEMNTDIFDKFIDNQTSSTGSKSTSETLYHILLQPFLHRSKSGMKEKSVVNDNIPTTATSTSMEIQTDKEPLHLLDLFRNKFLGISSSSPPINGSKSRGIGEGRSGDSVDPEDSDWQSFRSVQELKVAGIRCICTRTCYPKDVIFRRHSTYGELSLPAIVVDDSTKTKWLNLVAYEACPEFYNDLAFTSFVCFMDSLIDHAEDVKELRVQGVLLNGLGSDQNVADLFNDLGIDLTPDPNAYMKVKLGIQRHFKNRWGIWIAEALQTNFRTPWTTTAYFAAIFIIILTIIQTVLSFLQVL